MKRIFKQAGMLVPVVALSVAVSEPASAALATEVTTALGTVATDTAEAGGLMIVVAAAAAAAGWVISVII